MHVKEAVQQRRSVKHFDPNHVMNDGGTSSGIEGVAPLAKGLGPG